MRIGVPLAERVDVTEDTLTADLSVEGLLAGRASGESQRSFKRWLEVKRTGGGANDAP